MNRIFLTGVPGSRWSGIAQEIESEGEFDISDQTLRIESFNNDKISVNVNTDEKRF